MAKLLRLPAVIDATGLSRSSVYLKIQQGDFPPPVKLSERASAWVDDEVAAWIDRQIARRNRPNEAA
jgi:prophage regulatory protein